MERSNLHRQILFTPAEIGAPKALAAAARLRLHNPAIEVVAHDGPLTPANAMALVTGQSVVLDCTDNFSARFLVHDACRTAGVPLVSAAVHRYEGELNVYAPGATGCIHCQWSGLGAEALDAVGNCAGGPVFAPAVGVLGIQQAAETLKLLLGLGEVAVNRTRLVNLLDGTTLAIERAARPDCPVCGALEELSARPPAATDETLFADAARLGPGTQLAFLVEPGDTAAIPPGYERIAAGDLATLRARAVARPLLLTCRRGLRSAALARLLRAEGLANVYALAR